MPVNTSGRTRPMPWRPTSTGHLNSTAGVPGFGAWNRAAPWKGLPVHTFPTDDGGVDMKCPTEIGDRRPAGSGTGEAGLHAVDPPQEFGFCGLYRGPVFAETGEYEDPDATANANLSARLPYLFACCRFAHYLKCIVRDKIGSFKEREDMQRWLQKWIMQYVDGDPAHSTEIDQSRKPLAAAEVVVEEVEGNPGYYTSKFYLRPHYQLEGLTVSIRLVSKLPSVKEGLNHQNDSTS